MQKLLRWLDDNVLAVLSACLIIFIPLYPKLPLLDILPGYIVRVRLEDFVISFTILLWIVWLVRGKVKLLDNPLFKPIALYLVVGLLSMISAIFITQTVPLQALHIGKMFLHFLRRVEYFSLFFIFYSTVNNLRLLKTYLIFLLIAVTGVALYGFGQKYLYWPAFSTMNREYSKGWMLYLTQHARVISTFGGHYDLAAYVMMMLVILWSLFFSLKKWFLKALIFLIIAAAFWTLILTASRTSFIAYLGGLTFAFFLFAFKHGIKWSLKRWVTVITLSIVVMLSFGDLSERFTKLLRIDDRIAGFKSLLTSPIGKPPSEKAIFLENNPQAALAEITAKSDQPPSLTRPSDVYQDIPLPVQTGSASGEFVNTQRTYSKTAYIYDLSTAIRFDALWPMALKGFKRNVLLGSGYSTLNKTQSTQFTEAESTDNDYLRSLGETGLLGFAAFYGILLFILYYVWRNLTVLRDPIIFGLAVGLGGLLFGLLVNAVYIDVFESSKVAFLFWATVGFILGGINYLKKGKPNNPPPVMPGFADFKKTFVQRTARFLRSDLFFLILILTLTFTLRLYKINTPLADWHSWRQADTSSVTRNYVKHGVNLLYPVYDDLSNVASGKDNPKGLRMVEFPLYNFASVIVDKIFVGYNIDFSGRMTSILATLGSVVFLFLIVRKYLGRREAFIASAVYAVLPYNLFYTRVILPEPYLVFNLLGMVYFFDKWLSDTGKWLYLPLSFVFTAVSLLIKPFAAFWFLPMAYLYFKRFGISIKSVIGLGLYFAAAFIPFVQWRQWISQFPEGIPANMWLFNGDGIRFKGAFFYWLFAERLSKLILGYWGAVFLVLGIIYRKGKENWFFYLWGIAMLLYVTVVATGNVRHDYYQIMTIPIIAVFVARGIGYLLDLETEKFSKWKIYGLILVVFVFMEMFGWYQIRDFYNINHPEIVEAGQAVERKTNNHVLVIAPYNGDTAFLYQTNRSGWPVMQDDIDNMIKRGAQYYVSVNFDDLTNQLIKEALIEDPVKRKYKLIEKTDKYVIIQLVPDNTLPK